MSSFIRTVVAGTADVRGDDPVLWAALGWARTLSATLHLVHSCRGEEGDGRAPSTLASLADRHRHEEARDALLTRARMLAPDVPVVCHAGGASPSRLIVEVADETGAGLVIVGATRRGRVGRWLMGTTAQQVIRHASAPVVVVRGAATHPPRRVLLTGDLTELSAAVHAHTSRLVDALCAPERPAMRSLYVVPHEGELGDAARAELLEWSGADLEAFLWQRPRSGAPVESCVRLGHPAREIVAEAAGWEADLVVLGTRARRGAARMLWGSVAEEVLPGAPCDLLVVPLGVVERGAPRLLAACG